MHIPEIELSFCIPILNRLSDLKKTLKKNLEDNIDHANIIEFIVICFDNDNKCEDWIKTNFQEELRTNYLRFYKAHNLEEWHFGKAKNQFKKLMQGKIYASLDGDNFTGKNAGIEIINIFRENNYRCLLHQFRGEWGDGTCGRVALSKQDYIDIGYDESFLPRQWDDLDIILTTLSQKNDLTYISYKNNAIHKKSKSFRDFILENNISINSIELNNSNLMQQNSAVNNKNSNYLNEDIKLKHFQYFNSYSSFFKNSTIEELQTKYISVLNFTQHLMIKNIEAHSLKNLFLNSLNKNKPLTTPNSIVLVSCIRNEPNLHKWIEYYESLGVTHFFIVDDGSSPAIKDLVHSDKVWIWSPKAGKFRYSKAYWLELLIRAYANNNWILTVDSDEYIELPKKMDNKSHNHNLTSLIKEAEKQNIKYFPGLLIDLVPGPKYTAHIQQKKELPQEAFDHYYFTESDACENYKSNKSVIWSYGSNPNFGFRVDLRYWLNKTFDSLRKFPLFKMNESLHLNQGFHDLIYNNKGISADNLNKDYLILVKHYKFYNLQKDIKNPNLRPLNAYYHTTQKNIATLREKLFESLLKASTCSKIYPISNTDEHFRSHL